MKKIKFLIAVIFLLLITTFPINTYALNEPSTNSNYSYYDYVIDGYNININVNENNTFDIEETITAYFNTPKHGIFRKIPLKNKIVRLDGTTSTNQTEITNLSVNSEYKTSKENGNYTIKIGSEDNTIIGKKNYVIKYTYNLGKDPIKDYDELYYNIIGDEWDTAIGNITFTIKMPKSFDGSKLGFSSGYIGSTDSNNIKYSVNDNIITGSYDGILKPYEALTVRCELEEGYFVGAKSNTNYLIYLIYIIPVLFLLISLYFWYKYGRDNNIVETVEFYPPEGLNSLEVGFLYKGKADTVDVASLLIYLANKKYIKISEIAQKSLFFKYKDFKITKLKEYDGNNANEQLFFKGLFKSKISQLSLSGSDIDKESLNEVTSADLRDSFYSTTNEILRNMNNKDNKNKILEKSASDKQTVVKLLIIITNLLITVPAVIAYGDIPLILENFILTTFGFKIIWDYFDNSNMDRKTGICRIFTKIIALLLIEGIFIIIPIFLVFPAITQELSYFYGYILGIICIIGMFIVLKYLPKRTKYGYELLGRLKGFKNFLETAEIDKLEAMVTQNPTYFYDILPYAYALGISDKWIKNFETITIQAPSWYDSLNTFDVTTFYSFIDSTMTSTTSISSSDSSGGGEAGGGSGGGGGGSW